jgi:hypothetical protein
MGTRVGAPDEPMGPRYALGARGILDGCGNEPRVRAAGWCRCGSHVVGIGSLSAAPVSLRRYPSAVVVRGGVGPSACQGRWPRNVWGDRIAAESH